MNEQFILKVLDYILNNIEKVYGCEDFKVLAKLDKEHVEISVFTIKNDDTFVAYVSLEHASERINLSQKNYNLIMYKLGEIREKYINHEINIISDIINFKEHKPLTNIDNLFDEN